jgi:hypothetical protein
VFVFCNPHELQENLISKLPTPQSYRKYTIIKNYRISEFPKLPHSHGEFLSASVTLSTMSRFKFQCIPGLLQHDEANEHVKKR